MPPFVNIKVRGPKTLIRGIYTPELECDANWTWREFLSSRCRIDPKYLGANSTVVVRNAGYRTASTAWEAQLDDVARDLLENYASLRNLYTVRLVMKNASSIKQSPVSRPNASALRRKLGGVYRIPGTKAPTTNRMKDQDDVRSVSTEVEMRNLVKKGIQVNLIKPVVYDRLKSFDNAELLRIQNELQSLVKEGAWHRLTYRAPRAAHLLSKIFQINTQ